MAIERAYHINEDYIKVSKKGLEELRDHYDSLSKKYNDSFRQGYYLGKRDVCIELLKIFEPYKE